jgi:glyoxylate/hydroxypyruvate reductase A
LALLFTSPDDDPIAWSRALLALRPDLDLRIWPELGDPDKIEAALVWKPAPGLLAGLRNLEAIFSLGAGIDGLLADPTLAALPLCRMVDPSLARVMAEFVLTQALFYHRRLDVYDREQRAGRWAFELPRSTSATTVGVLGMGELGRVAAATLAAHGFTVRGWSRGRRAEPGVTSFAGTEELGAFLAATDILVCLLPLTAETENILDRRLFGQLPRGARLINVGRGRHLVEADLLAALDEGRLAHAALDVFRDEPLPEGHAFWRHPRIRVTPHVASFCEPQSAAPGVIENLRRLEAGLPLLHVVERERGY